MGIERKKETQIDSMDDELRARIWNTIKKFYFTSNVCTLRDVKNGGRFSMETDEVVAKIFDGFFKKDVGAHKVRHVKVGFYALAWHKVYDFVEFMLSNLPPGQTEHMRDELNRVLQDESAGYSIIYNKITPITNELEMDEVEKAQHTGIDEVNRHIKSSIEHLSRRDSPDLNNATKEAISAVEALCKKIAGDSDSTLGQALSKIQSNDPKHIDPHLEGAIRKLYRFSSDASGVRHSHAEGKTQVGFDEAKFMVVACSAIVNYLVKHAASG